MDGYQPTHGDHEANLATALDEFEQALTRRWREEICWRLSAGMDDYPRPARAATPPEPAWDYRLYPHWLHIQGHCAYIDWALSGQESDLSAVSCPGYTGAPEELWTDPRSGEQGFVPAHVECGMDRVMLQAADWAYQERQHVSEQLPLFTSHDMRALRSAYDAFVQLGVEHLGMEPEGGAGASHSFRPVDEREIGSKVHLLAGKDGDGGDWWVGWTGLAARRAEAGFFASIAPTLNNQSRIVAALANLYAQRAAIIEKGRNDTLCALGWATQSLDNTVRVASGSRTGWVVVQGLGLGISTVFGWSGAGAVAGAGVSLFGFLGEHISQLPREEYEHDLMAILDRLNGMITNLHYELSGAHLDYWEHVIELREMINQVFSYNLELYDLTRNNPDGDVSCRDTAFEANIGAILRVSQLCFDLAEAYAGLLPILEGTGIADQHLADKDGRPTYADRKLVEVRDFLIDLFRTTIARYLVAGRQVQEAAETYVETDFANAADIEVFNRTMAEWEEMGVGPPEVGFDPETHATETERPPPGWGPAYRREDGSAVMQPGDSNGGDDERESEYAVQSEPGEE